MFVLARDVERKPPQPCGLRMQMVQLQRGKKTPCRGACLHPTPTPSWGGSPPTFLKCPACSCSSHCQAQPWDVQSPNTKGTVPACGLSQVMWL